MDHMPKLKTIILLGKKEKHSQGKICDFELSKIS